mmetsp:Transcript_8011/g.26334  ORF Transcript_8011/g.26334 Transcript_8011/m.26334 type:complete len:238 (-) Transcript_8011:600-1313(-)
MRRGDRGASRSRRAAFARPGGVQSSRRGSPERRPSVRAVGVREVDSRARRGLRERRVRRSFKWRRHRGQKVGRRRGGFKSGVPAGGNQGAVRRGHRRRRLDREEEGQGRLGEREEADVATVNSHGRAAAFFGDRRPRGDDETKRPRPRRPALRPLGPGNRAPRSGPSPALRDPPSPLPRRPPRQRRRPRGRLQGLPRLRRGRPRTGLRGSRPRLRQGQPALRRRQGPRRPRRRGRRR